jgi:hypothetical protein
MYDYTRNEWETCSRSDRVYFRQNSPNEYDLTKMISIPGEGGLDYDEWLRREREKSVAAGEKCLHSKRVGKI